MPLHCCIASLLAAKYQLCCFRYGLRLFTIYLALPFPLTPAHVQQQHLNCLVDTSTYPHTHTRPYIYYIVEPDNDRYGTIEDFSLHIVVVIFSNLDAPDLHFHRTLPNLNLKQTKPSASPSSSSPTHLLSLPHLSYLHITSHHNTATKS